MGLVNDPQDIQIDYSIPVPVVYRRWALSRIRRTHSLDVLSACAHSAQSGDLPSWVSDLRRPWANDRPLWYLAHRRPFAAQNQKTAAAEGFPWVQDFPSNEDFLRLPTQGYLVDKISILSSVADISSNLPDPTNITARLMEIITSWESMVQEHIGLRAATRILWEANPMVPSFLAALLRGYKKWGKEKTADDLEKRYLH